MTVDAGGSAARSVRDLVALSSLAAIWVDQSPQQIGSGLAEALSRIAGTSLVFVRIDAAWSERPSVEHVVVDGRVAFPDESAALAERLRPLVQHPRSLGPRPFSDPAIGGDGELITMPIGFGGRQGAVAVAATAFDYSADVTRMLVSVAANQAGTALVSAQLNAERSRLLELERSRSSQIQALARASLAFHRVAPIEEILRTVTEAAADVTGGRLAVGTLHASTDREGLETTVERGGLPGRAAPGPLAAEDVLELDQESIPEADAPRRALAAALRSRDGQRFGRLYVGDKPAGFTDEDQGMLLQLAQTAAIAIQNVELFERMERLAVDLSRANAIKDELLGLVSHELRTPLTTIVGMTEVLRRRSTDADSASVLDDIAGEADRLQRLIENMLVLARIESDKLAFEPILLQRTVPAQIAEVRRRYPEREIRLDIPDTMLPVIAQPTYVEQIIHNLLTNAAKYSRPGSPIEIRAVEREPVAAILVLDKGEVVDPTELPRLFEPFFRSSRARHMSGAGLGLAVCKRLVEAQSGEIWARAREGGGLELGFTLPLFDEEADLAAGDAADAVDTVPSARD